MSDAGVEVRWTGEQRFDATGRAGSVVVLDGTGAAGPSPMEAVLMGLAGCMAVDVVDILAKMRVPIAGLTVRAEGDRRSAPPRRYTAVRLIYRPEGLSEADLPKLQRAIDLSRDTYCSVLHSLQPDTEMEIRVEMG